ncbi:hypothetical protein BACSTE_03118 [Bacteroides stercoris ATCC 43183]|uniref:Uncharacterized protein n=1 Tax=Bacteroides stercoris ATCC 43183 TaxID=449673 RepID=B0NUD3_BACSE|nr:hypothetical protein BACSTE_03118 [Bacteroides stercoris ATCC 43183]
MTLLFCHVRTFSELCALNSNESRGALSSFLFYSTFEVNPIKN